MENLILDIEGETLEIDLNWFIIEPGNAPQLEERLAKCSSYQAILSTALAQKRAELELARLELDRFEAEKYRECYLQAAMQLKVKSRDPSITAIKAQLWSVAGHEYSRHRNQIIRLQKEVDILEGITKTFFHLGYYIQTLLKGEVWSNRDYYSEQEINVPFPPRPKISSVRKSPSRSDPIAAETSHRGSPDRLAEFEKAWTEMARQRKRGE